MNIRGAIFDFDGTLFDSMGIWETAGEDYLASMGIPAEPDLAERLKPMSMQQSAQYLKMQYSLPQSPEQIQREIDQTVADYYFSRTLPKQGVPAFLEKLRQEGVPMCIATATDRALVEAALTRCGLLGYFEKIFTCSEVGRGKDVPDIFECARDFLGTEHSKTAVFEDACHAGKTAKDAGFLLIGIYDRFEPRTKDLEAISHRYVGSFSELEGLSVI